MDSEMIHTTYRNLTEAITTRARRMPSARLLTLLGDHEPHHFTAADLEAQGHAYARGLRRAGVEPDDVVVLAIGDLPQLIGAVLGALYRGAIPAIASFGVERLDRDIHRARVAALVRSCAPRALVCTAERAALFQSLVEGLGCETLSCEDLYVPPTNGGSDTWPGRAPDDIAYLQYSSGTAGAQKGVMHTHRGVLRYLESKRKSWAVAHDVLVSWLPLYHDLGFVSGLLCPLVLGTYGVLMSPQQWIRDPKILFRALHEYRGSISFMPNFALNHCVRIIRDRDLEGIDLSHWNELVIGGEPVREDSLRMFAERFAPYGFRPSGLRIGYGMAELVEGVTGSVICQLPDVDWIDRVQLETHQRAVPAPPRQPGSVSVVSCGLAIEGAELRVVDAQGEALPERHVGEILIRSEYMFRGYYLQPELTARVMRGDWFCSGDLGYLADGQLYLTGRKNDLIIVGGRNVHPEDLEPLADKIPGIYPGRVVAFGVPDALSGSERIVLLCETAPECDAAQQLAIERRLRSQVTQEFGVTLGDIRFLPRGWIIKTSSGKNARPDNRAKYLAQCAGSDPHPPRDSSS